MLPSQMGAGRGDESWRTLYRACLLDTLTCLLQPPTARPSTSAARARPSGNLRLVSRPNGWPHIPPRLLLCAAARCPQGAAGCLAHRLPAPAANHKYGSTHVVEAMAAS